MTRRIVVILCFVAGVIFSSTGIHDMNESIPSCNGQVMEPGDECLRFGPADSGASSYDQALAGTRKRGHVFVGLGAVLIAGGCWQSVVLWRRRRPGTAPIDGRGTIVLTPEQARSGTTRKVTVSTWKMCGRCQGGTWVAGERCRRCRASGLGGRTWRRVTLRVPAGIRRGTTLRVRGAGVPGVPSVRPAGDLRVRVRILGFGRSLGVPARRPGPDGAEAADVITGRVAQTVPEQNARTPRSATRTGGRGGSNTGQPGGTVMSRVVQIIADAEGLQVRRNLHQALWETDLRMPWHEIRRLAFDTAPHDPVIALYVWTSEGPRRYICDAAHLSKEEWRTLARYIEACTQGRVALDLASRDKPHLA